MSVEERLSCRHIAGVQMSHQGGVQHESGCMTVWCAFTHKKKKKGFKLLSTLITEVVSATACDPDENSEFNVFPHYRKSERLIQCFHILSHRSDNASKITAWRQCLQQVNYPSLTNEKKTVSKTSFHTWNWFSKKATFIKKKNANRIKKCNTKSFDISDLF